MNSLATSQALKAYAQIDIETSVTTATPLQLIVILYDGALSAISAAKGQMQQKKYAEKGRLISKAVGIIEGLRAVLDHERGGEISRNLNDLYEYMKRVLTMANLKNEPEKLDEITRLLNELREAWAILAVREKEGTLK